VVALEDEGPRSCKFEIGFGTNLGACKDKIQPSLFYQVQGNGICQCFDRTTSLFATKK